MENVNFEPKELAPIKEAVSKAVGAAETLIIAKVDDMVNATDLLGRIKSVGKIIKDKKEAITKPLNEALRQVRSFFAPVELEFNKAEGIVKDKMLAFQREQAAKAAIQTAKIEKKVEDGKMTMAKAAEKIEAVTPKKQVETAVGVAQFRTVKEVIIENESLLPREYLLPDMVKIRKVALAGVNIPGVKVNEKQVVAGKGF